jgi:hypothetical protein
MFKKILGALQVVYVLFLKGKTINVKVGGKDVSITLPSKSHEIDLGKK